MDRKQTLRISRNSSDYRPRFLTASNKAFVSDPNYCALVRRMSKSSVETSTPLRVSVSPNMPATTPLHLFHGADRHFSPFMNGPKSHSPQSLASMSSQHLPPACGARQLGKLKRFLTTLIAFGTEISNDTGDRVKAVILALVNSSITVEEFHNKLQEITNFPLRPFVIPFLKANLPLLQRELLHCARLNRQSPAQYLSSNEQFLFDPATLAGSSSEPATSPVERDRSVIGHTTPPSTNSDPSVTPGVKRKLNRDDRDSSGDEAPPLTKRPSHLSSSGSTAAASISPVGGGSHLSSCPAPLNLSASSSSSVHQHFSEQFDRDRERIFRSLNHSSLELSFRPTIHPTTPEACERLQSPEEWKSIEELLNKIMDNTSRIRSLVSVVRERSRREQEQLSGLLKERKLMTKATPSEDQINDIKRRASYYYEEAVSEVKRQALIELQKAISNAEQRAGELLAQERGKMQREVDDLRRKIREDAEREFNVQVEDCESCWNCGRKASETCSGCNVARYCGSFCQHKDWNRHQSMCGNRKEGSDSEETHTRGSDDCKSVDVKEEAVQNIDQSCDS